MRIILIGLFSFLAWSMFSGYYYVCHIKDLCDEVMPVKEQEMMIEYSEQSAPDPATKKTELKAPEAQFIYFAYNSDRFENEDRLNVYAGEMKAYLENAPDMLLVITGHTDASGTASYNMDLGNRRAESVASWCKTHGIPSERLLTESKGESAPIASNETSSGRQKNRRVEFNLKQK